MAHTNRHMAATIQPRLISLTDAAEKIHCADTSDNEYGCCKRVMAFWLLLIKQGTNQLSIRESMKLHSMHLHG